MQTAMASASPPYAPSSCGSQSAAASPSAPAYRRHRAGTPGKPPTESETKHTGSPHSTGHTPASSAATEESAHPPSFAAAAALAPHSRETSPQTTPSTQAAAAPAPQPPPAPASAAPHRARDPSPETAAQSRPR